MKRAQNPAFYVVAREPGAENPSLPTWASRELNPAGLAEQFPAETIVRREVPHVPGAYQLLNVLSRTECQSLIELSEGLGYLEDAAVTLPREIRHNDNMVWVTDETTDEILWRRMASLATLNLEIYRGRKPLGLNARFRFYRYRPGDYFSYHSDGAWPGSRVIDGYLITNAYSDRYSQQTVLIFLNDDFEGGATRFLVNREDPPSRTQLATDNSVVDIRTPIGGILCFPHGMHPLHCIHSSEPITNGTKYIIRTDMLFEIG